MAINFPSSPALNDTFSASGITYKWNGTAWRIVVPTLTISGLSDWPAAVSALEVSYLDGVTSGIQSQINGKLSSVDVGYTASTRVLTSSGGTGFTFPLMSSADAGLVPASGGGTANFLRADGTWAAVNGTTDLTYTASTRLLESSTGADATLPLFTSTEAGLVPLSGGGTTNFLRADGTWAAAGGAGATNLSYDAATRVIASDTGTDATLPLFSTSAATAGLTPGSSGGTTTFLRADGTWAGGYQAMTAYADLVAEPKFISYYNIPTGSPTGGSYFTGINSTLNADQKYGWQMVGQAQGGAGASMWVRKKDNNVYGGWVQIALADSGTYALNISGNAATATTLSGDSSNWASLRSSAVANMLGWKNYGNSHVIFDASQSTAPNGTAVNNTNAQVAWTGSYPTLMGWNGANTYGVRVDSARIADYAVTSGSSGFNVVNPTSLGTGGTVIQFYTIPLNTYYKIIIGWDLVSTNGTSPLVLRDSAAGATSFGCTSVMAGTISTTVWASTYINLTGAIAAANTYSGYTILERDGTSGAMPIWSVISVMVRNDGLQVHEARGHFYTTSVGTTPLWLSTVIGTQTFDGGSYWVKAYNI